MKKLFIFILIFICFSSYAGIIPIETARKVALNFYFERANAVKPVSIESISITQEFTETQNSVPVIYIFNIGYDKGYIIVSAESNTIPVLAYSFEKNYFVDNISPAFKGIINSYKNDIIDTRDKNLTSTDEINRLWTNYTNTTFKSASSITGVTPLLGNLIWNQGCYYNSLLPADNDPGYCNHVPTGCVATAMAMIMKYNNWPSQGQGSHSYVHSVANGFSHDFGTFSANFSTSTYNWASIPLDVTSANAEVAKIMFQCGVAVEMDYDYYGSGAFVGVPPGYSNPTAQKALVNYFKYPTAAYFEKVNFSDAAWKAKIKTDIDASRPIIYAGDGTQGGHAFILDGYSGTNNDYFHFNFGWGGYYNGHFYISSINSGNGDFTSNQEGIFTISHTMTAIEEVNSKVTIDIYPNPSNGFFTVNFSELSDTKTKLEIYNLIGKKIWENTCDKESITINLSDFPKGVYFLNVKSANNSITKKITIVK